MEKQSCVLEFLSTVKQSLPLAFYFCFFEVKYQSTGQTLKSKQTVWKAVWKVVWTQHNNSLPFKLSQVFHQNIEKIKLWHYRKKTWIKYLKHLSPSNLTSNTLWNRNFSKF